MLFEIKITSPKIWTQITLSIFNNDNHYTTSASIEFLNGDPIKYTDLYYFLFCHMFIS